VRELVGLKEKYDVIIIGGGISGLTSSALFSKAGISCCVLEMDNRPGGYLAGFRRYDYRFDSAIHWLNNCGPDGLVTKIFKIIGKDFPKAKEQKKIRRFVSDEFDYLVTNNPDELKEQWIKEFPEDKEGIIRFFEAAKKIARSFDDHTNLSRTIETMNIFEMTIHGLKMLKFILPFIPHVRYSGNEGLKKGLNKYFKAKKLHQLFCTEPDLLSCLVPIAWAYSKDFQTPPTGGSQVYPEWLMHVTQDLGNQVFFKCKVLEVLTKNNTAVGVKFDHRGTVHEIQAKYVVAACDVETLYEKMLPVTAVPKKMKDKLKGAKLYASAITVSIALDCPAEELGFGEEIIFLADPNLPREEYEKGNPETSGIHILASTTRDKSLAPENCGTLTIFIPAFFEQNNFWGCEMDENGNLVRGEKYKEIKQQYADILIRRVEEKFAPELSKHIVYCDVATPITHWRYTGNRGGTMMGAKPGEENMKAGIAHYKTPVKNLLLSGHWADLGGGIPLAIKSSLNTTLMVLKKENKKAFHKLAQYMDGKISIDELENSKVLADYSNNWKQELTPAQKKALREQN
jgi:phytoene dehydrogenase-like protein